MPSLDATYRFAEGGNVYAQVSKGSLVPSQSFFYTANPTLGNQVNPETSTAVQLGVVRQTGTYGIGLDLYNISFDNYVSTVVHNGDTLYVNSGSVRYRGVETEGHLKLGAGVTAVINASLIRATFQHSDMTSSIQMAGDTIPYATYRVNAYSYTNATVTRNLVEWIGTRNVRLTFAINNLWDSHAATDNAGPSIAPPYSYLVNVLPRLNYIVSVVADL